MNLSKLFSYISIPSLFKVFRCFRYIYDGGDVKETPPSYISMAKPVIICGDLNVAASPLDIKNPKANVHNAGYTQEERDCFSRLLKSGYIDTFRRLYPDEVKYSWWSYRFNSRAKNAGWRIDYFLTSESLQDRIQDAKIHTDIFGSDHCPIELDISL